MVYLISQAVAYGPKSAMVGLFGVISGFVFYMMTTSIGLAAFFKSFPAAFDTLKLFGAIYLLWLAFRSTRAKPLFNVKVIETAIPSNRSVFRNGMITNILNPKVALIFIAIIPQFLENEIGNIALQSIVLGNVMISISFIINTTIIILVSKFGKILRLNSQIFTVQNWIIATIFTAFAVSMIWDLGRT